MKVGEVIPDHHASSSSSISVLIVMLLVMVATTATSPKSLTRLCSWPLSDFLRLWWIMSSSLSVPAGRGFLGVHLKLTGLWGGENSGFWVGSSWPIEGSRNTRPRRVQASRLPDPDKREAMKIPRITVKPRFCRVSESEILRARTQGLEPSILAEPGQLR